MLLVNTLAGRCKELKRCPRSTLHLQPVIVHFPTDLQSSASFQGEFYGLLKLSVARDLAGRVAVEVGVDDAEEGLAECHFDVHETWGES